MKIYVLSDTHNSFGFAGFLEKINTADIVIHCGDGSRDKEDLKSVASCPVYSVKGNCDLSGESFCVIEAEGHRIFVTHGHLFGVKSDLRPLIAAAKENLCDIVLFGHTHIPLAEFTLGVWAINPGSLARPVKGRFGTYCELTIEKDSVYPKMIEFI